MLQPYYSINSNRSQHPSHSSQRSLATALDHTQEDLTESVLVQHCALDYCWLFLSQPMRKIPLWDSELDLLINRNWSNAQQCNTVFCNPKCHHTHQKGCCEFSRLHWNKTKQIHLNLYVSCHISVFKKSPKGPKPLRYGLECLPCSPTAEARMPEQKCLLSCWEGHQGALDSFSNDDNFWTASLSTTSRIVLSSQLNDLQLFLRQSMRIKS